MSPELIAFLTQILNYAIPVLFTLLLHKFGMVPTPNSPVPAPAPSPSPTPAPSGTGHPILDQMMQLLLAQIMKAGQSGPLQLPAMPPTSGEPAVKFSVTPPQVVQH